MLCAQSLIYSNALYLFDLDSPLIFCMMCYAERDKVGLFVERFCVCLVQQCCHSADQQYGCCVNGDRCEFLRTVVVIDWSI